MQLIATSTDWENESDSNRAQRDMQNWLDKLSQENKDQLISELTSDEADWEKGMMKKASDESDRIIGEICADYARFASSGHSLSVVAL